MGRGSSWKKDQDRSKFRNITAVAIAAALLFATVNGIFKGFSLKDEFQESRWDGKSAFAVGVNSLNPSLFVYQPDSQTITALVIDSESFYETGRADKPLVKFSSVLEESDSEMTRSFSNAYGIKISNFIKFKERSATDEEFAQKMFVDFASLITPFKIMTVGYGDDILITNITRIDALKLWWQLKGLRADSLKYKDLSSLSEKIIDERGEYVMGVATDSLHRIVSEYVDNFEMAEESKNIQINNVSGSLESARLATLFIKASGGNVNEVLESSGEEENTRIISEDRNSYTAVYLANIFDCDITEAKNLENSDEIVVNLGTDFTQKYFE